jgi:hypothetical protein
LFKVAPPKRMVPVARRGGRAERWEGRTRRRVGLVVGLGVSWFGDVGDGEDGWSGMWTSHSGCGLRVGEGLDILVEEEDGFGDCEVFLLLLVLVLMVMVVVGRGLERRWRRVRMVGFGIERWLVCGDDGTGIWTFSFFSLLWFFDLWKIGD